MSNKTLWDFFDGEPFMENPALGLLGANSPRKGRKMAVRRKKRSTRRRGRKAAAPRRRRTTVRRSPRRRSTRRRRNWIASGMVVPPNPRRRRSHRRHANPKRRHHRRHRNPALFGLTIPPVKTVLFAGVGFVGPSFVSGLLNSFAPSIVQQVTQLGVAGKYVMKIGSIALLAWATKKFVGAGEAMAVAIGGGANVAISLVNDFAPGILPANPLAMYVPNRTMQAYVPTRGNLRGLKGPYQLQGGNVNPASVRQMATAAGFPGSLTDATQYGKFGGTAARLYRY